MIVSVAIGNSDDKLSQAEWSDYVNDVNTAIMDCLEDGDQLHFSGFSPSASRWQNALFTVALGPHAEVSRGRLRSRLADLCGKYRQDSIAWWEAAEAEMIPPAQVRRP